jgi:hypothetical protein
MEKFQEVSDIVGDNTNEWSIDTKARNTIPNYDDWVKEVQRIMVDDLFIPPDSFLVQPHDGSSALRSWKEMFDRGTNPAAMAWYAANVFN